MYIPIYFITTDFLVELGCGNFIKIEWPYLTIFLKKKRNTLINKILNLALTLLTIGVGHIVLLLMKFFRW